jgi:tetratricopeptide (TPR) repeat protein
MFIRLMGLACAALLWTFSTTARAEWRAAETEHFIIYSESSPKDIERLAERLEKIDGLMRLATGIKDDVEPVKVRIYEVPTTRDVEAALGLSDTGIAGFYNSNILGPFAVTPRKTYYETSLFGPELVLHHEYAHHFMLQYFPSTYPSWYTEGFAELMGSSKILPDGKVGYGMPARHRGDQLAASWVPLTEALIKPASKLYGFDTYGQGWAMSHFFTFSKERSPQFRRYLQLLKAGRSLEDAAKTAFGDLEKLNREARSYVLAGSFTYKPVEVPIRRPVVQKLRTLGAGEAALIPEVIAFRDDDLAFERKSKERGREKRLRDENLHSIRRKAQRYPADPFALLFLAEAEYAAGNYAESEAAADRLLAREPGNVRAMVRKSLTMSQTARKLQGQARVAKVAEARALAQKANKADPNEPLAFLAFFQSYQLVGEKPPKAAVEALRGVVETLPRDFTIRQLLVDQLAAERRWAEAIAYLTPIANLHWESPGREAARKQLEELQAELAKEQGAKAAG